VKNIHVCKIAKGIRGLRVTVVVEHMPPQGKTRFITWCHHKLDQRWGPQPADIFGGRSKWLCCNLSGGVALIVWFTTNGMCAKNKNICMWREQAIIEWSRWSDLGERPLTMLVNLVNSWLCLRTVTTRLISSGDLYCCLLPRCEALRTCRSGFPIATIVTCCTYMFLRISGGEFPRCHPWLPACKIYLRAFVLLKTTFSLGVMAGLKGRLFLIENYYISIYQ